MKDFEDYSECEGNYILDAPLKVALGRPNMEYDYNNILLNEGYVWDVSCPKYLKWFMSEKVNIPSCLHDYLLENGYEKKFADQQFFKALRVKGCSIPYSFVLWLAVRSYSLRII